MTVRPILFSAPMIRALLVARKTQTRRILKPQPPTEDQFPGSSFGLDRAAADSVAIYSQNQYTADLPRHPTDWDLIGSVGVARDAGFPNRYRVPYAVGDLLWVRETFFHGVVARDGTVEDWSEYHYRATEPEIEGVDDGDGYSETNADGSLRSPWKPSIHMPRRASRITLDVTDVRVERLQAISDEDAIAEGVSWESADPPFYYVPEIYPHSLTAVGVEEPGGRHAQRSYFKLWDLINGMGHAAENPWVVAVSFRVHVVNVDEFLKQKEAA